MVQAIHDGKSIQIGGHSAMSTSDSKWEAWKMVCLAKNQCPYSGLGGPECKSWLCDCFEFEDIWGVSQK